MSQDTTRFLPILAEALKDIYTKMDNITNKLGNVAETLKQFFDSIGQKNMIIIQNLKKLQGVITDFEKGESLKNIILLINESIMDIKDGIWFLEFQKALSRFKEKVEEF